MLHRNHQGTFRKGNTETTRNVLLRFSYNLLGTFPQGYQKTIRERYWGTFMNVWETFHFNVMGTLHGNVFCGFGGTFWERSGNVKLLAGTLLRPCNCLVSEMKTVKFDLVLKMEWHKKVKMYRFGEVIWLYLTSERTNHRNRYELCKNYIWNTFGIKMKSWYGKLRSHGNDLRRYFSGWFQHER